MSALVNSVFCLPVCLVPFLTTELQLLMQAQLQNASQSYDLVVESVELLNVLQARAGGMTGGEFASKLGLLEL